MTMPLIPAKRINLPPFYVIVGDDPGAFMRSQDEQLALWVYERRPGDGKYLWTYNLSNDTWEQVKLTEEMPDETPRPTFTVPYSLIAPLVAALTDYRPPDQATQRHLEDAIAVRDRVMMMLETFHKPPELLPYATAYAGPAREAPGPA